MNTDVEYMKSRLLRKTSGSSAQMNSWAREVMLEETQQNTALQQDEQSYMLEQEDDAKRFEARGREMQDMFSDIQTQIEDEKLSGALQSALADKSRRAKFGDPAPEGISRSLAAAKKHYGDMLHYREVAGEFAGSVGEDKKRVLDVGTASAREKLKQTFKKNFGATEDEAEAYVERNFGEFDDPTLWDKIKSVPGVLANQFMVNLDRLGLVTSAPVQGAMAAGIETGMSQDQFFEHHPEQAAQLALLSDLAGKEKLSKTEKTLYKNLHGVLKVFFTSKNTMSAFTGKLASEGKRALEGRFDDGSTMDAFAKQAAKGNKTAETWIKRVMPWVEPSVVIGTEVKAAKLAMKAPDYFFKNTWRGVLYDIFLPGRAGAWQMGEASAQAVNTAIDSTTKVQAATGGLGIPAREAALKRWYHQAAIERYQRQWADGPPVEEIQKLKIAEDIKNGDLTDEVSREAATNVVNHIRKSTSATQEDIENANRLEAQVREAAMQAKSDKGKSAPGTAAAPNPEAPNLVQRMIDDFKSRGVTVVPQRGRKTKGKREALGWTRTVGDGRHRVWYKDNLTREELLSYDAPALDRIGYSKQLLDKLIRSDDEARLFVLLHEDGHVRAGDYLEQLPRIAPKDPLGRGGAYAIMRKEEREELAMYHALNQFSAMTGRPYHDVSVPEVSPGSYTKSDPETGNMLFRAIPKPELPPTRTDDELDIFFKYAGGLDAREAAKKVATMVKTSGKGVGRVDAMDPNTQALRQMIPESEFIELGEAFNLPIELGEGSIKRYSDQVYSAFTWRYGATENQVAKGTKRFWDATEEYNVPYSDGQLAKMEEIINTWRGLKDMNRRAQGTVHERNVADLMLWFKSEVSNGGKSYREVFAKTEAINREAKAKASGVEWVNPTQPGTAMGTREAAEGMDVRSVVQDKPGGATTSMSEADLSKNQGQVFPDKKPQSEIASGAPTVNYDKKTGKLVKANDPAKNKGMRVATGQAFGPENAESIAVRSDDAMANAASLEDMADGGDAIAASRAEDMASQVQSVPEGQVKPPSPSLRGSPAHLRVLELEEFAGVGTTASPVVDGRINIFHAGSDDLSDSFRAILARPNGEAMLDQTLDTLIDTQIAGMARKIHDEGGDVTEMLLFHRALATAKALEEIKFEGKLSAGTRDWLDSMDLRVGADGGTIEEAVLNGVSAANDRYGFAFNMQQDYQNVVDTQMAVLFNSLPDSMARKNFVRKYSKIMSGEKAVKTRRELNRQRGELRKMIGGPCA